MNREMMEEKLGCLVWVLVVLLVCLLMVFGPEFVKWLDRTSYLPVPGRE